MVRAFLGLALLVARLAAAYPRTCATARTRGLSCADHNVTTRDGYVLETHTVWNARVASPARVVVLQHGLIDSSETWVANYGGESLARQLADDGWLVYLANSRGRPPYRHATLGPDDAAFWAFSWDEMAALDLPATVDHALHVANATRASFVGHSQGTTLAMAGLAENATLADLVDVAVLLAPVAILDEGAFGNLTGLVGIADWLCARLPETCDMSIWDAVHAAAPVLCAWPLGYAACLEALCDIAGCKAKNNYNETVLVRRPTLRAIFRGTETVSLSSGPRPRHLRPLVFRGDVLAQRRPLRADGAARRDGAAPLRLRDRGAERGPLRLPDAAGLRPRPVREQGRRVLRHGRPPRPRGQRAEHARAAVQRGIS